MEEIVRFFVWIVQGSSFAFVKIIKIVKIIRISV